MYKAAGALTSLPSNIDCNWRQGSKLKRTHLIEDDKCYVPIILFKQKVGFILGKGDSNLFWPLSQLQNFLCWRAVLFCSKKCSSQHLGQKLPQETQPPGPPGSHKDELLPAACCWRCRAQQQGRRCELASWSAESEER